MAHLPRWIDSPIVDSSAMWLARHTLIRKLKDERETIIMTIASARDNELVELVRTGDALSVQINELESLFEIRHAPFDSGPEPEYAWRQCTTADCARCASSRGGYKFRWYSRSWAKTDNESKRPGSWEAPE